MCAPPGSRTSDLISHCPASGGAVALTTSSTDWPGASPSGIATEPTCVPYASEPSYSGTAGTSASDSGQPFLVGLPRVVSRLGDVTGAPPATASGPEVGSEPKPEARGVRED